MVVYPQQRKEWERRAAAKKAVVPLRWTVYSTKRVEITCGHCQNAFERSFVMNINDPVFVCPHCKTRNFVPIKFKKRDDV